MCRTQSRFHAEIAHVSIAAMRLRAFISICVHLRTFASTVCDRADARTCVYMCAT